jgi:predicted cupin superfamily sugar epimerase
MTADEIIKRLRLQPHPKENGYFVETYRSDESIPSEALSSRYKGTRNHSTAIYFLLKAGAFSEMHRICSDEIFHFYLGDPAELLLLTPGQGGRIHRIGNRLNNGELPQVIVPRSCWQGLRTTGAFSLLGTTVAPGFEYADYESGKREELIREYPEFADQIRLLTD